MQKNQTAESVRDHFDRLAESYEQGKRWAWYYYAALENLVRKLVPPGSRVLDIGCGIGDILNGVSPRVGVGIDTSQEMVRRAIQKHPQPHLSFKAVDLLSFQDPEPFGCVVFTDVIEHLDRQEESIAHLRDLTAPGSRVVMTMANPFWEPLLLLLERLNMKMPEGPHNRPSVRNVMQWFNEAGFELLQKGEILPFPMYIPFFSNAFNRIVESMPLVRRLGLIQYFVFHRRDR